MFSGSLMKSAVGSMCPEQSTLVYQMRSLKWFTRGDDAKLGRSLGGVFPESLKKFPNLGTFFESHLDMPNRHGRFRGVARATLTSSGPV